MQWLLERQLNIVLQATRVCAHRVENGQNSVCKDRNTSWNKKKTRIVPPCIIRQHFCTCGPPGRKYSLATVHSRHGDRRAHQRNTGHLVAQVPSDCFKKNCLQPQAGSPEQGACSRDYSTDGWSDTSSGPRSSHTGSTPPRLHRSRALCGPHHPARSRETGLSNQKLVSSQQIM